MELGVFFACFMSRHMFNGNPFSMGFLGLTTNFPSHQPKNHQFSDPHFFIVSLWVVHRSGGCFPNCLFLFVVKNPTIFCWLVKQPPLISPRSWRGYCDMMDFKSSTLLSTALHRWPPPRKTHGSERCGGGGMFWFVRNWNWMENLGEHIGELCYYDYANILINRTLL